MFAFDLAFVGARHAVSADATAGFNGATCCAVFVFFLTFAFDVAFVGAQHAALLLGTIYTIP
jgi:hypothetical protein